MIIPDWLEIASRNHPHKLALAFEVERWSFSELQNRVTVAAETLAAAFPEPMGRIGVLSFNRPGLVLAVHAAMRLGVPFVPLNSRLSPAEIAWQIKDAGVTVLIADERYEASADREITAGTVVIPISDLEKALSAPLTRGSMAMRGSRERSVSLQHEAAVFYTSGTSGRPKGAILTYGNLWFSAIASALHLGHHADDVWLLTLPLFHIGGLSILTRGAIGATSVVLHDHFDPLRALATVDAGATLISLVPTMLERMIAVRGERPWPAHLRCVLLGGSAASARLVADARKLGIPIAPTYGLTEATSQVTTLLPDQCNKHIESSGRPLPMTRVRISTPSGVAPAGDVGEIEILGATVFSGYLGAEEARDPSAWFATGDVGYLDSDGFLHVVDRRADLIVSGGENIYPAEIERVLAAHPRVADVGVVGLPHETWGARPIAAVVWIGDPEDAEGELRIHCARELAGYKIPDRFILAAALPRTASGKLLRRALSERIAPGISANAADHSG